MSEEQNFWQMGQEQQLCSQKTHASLHTLGLPFGKHHKRQFTARGKGTVFDNRCQDTVLLNLSRGCCRWMSHWAGKRSTLNKEAVLVHDSTRNTT